LRIVFSLIGREKGLDAGRRREEIGCVPQLRCLDGDHPGEVKDVLLAKKVEPPRPPAELAVEEGIVVRPPVDLGNIKVARDVEVPTETSQLLPLHRLPLDPRPNAFQGIRELAEAVIRLSRHLHLVSDIRGQLHFEAAGKRGFTLEQTPLVTAVTVLAAFHERAPDLNLGAEQMLPLVPGSVPDDGHR
jgi:hypothetical protein